MITLSNKSTSDKLLMDTVEAKGLKLQNYLQQITCPASTNYLKVLFPTLPFSASYNRQEENLSG